MSNSVGAPGNVPSAGLDVAADLLQIGNRRAETVTLGKRTDSTGAQIYRGIEINNFPGTLAQPDIIIGSPDEVAPGGVGSFVGCFGRTIVLQAEDGSGNTAPINLFGQVSVNGAPIAPAPAYLEVARSLPATVPGAYVDFNTVLGSAGTSVALSDPTTFTFSSTGSYEITWKVTTDTGPAPLYVWELQSGAITAPTAKAFPLPPPQRPLETTVSGIPAPGLVYGQVIVTVSVVPAALKLMVLSAATYYVAAGSISASVIVRQIAN